jgi:hypothetical protein
MAKNLREKLKKDIMTAQWEDLKVHIERQAVFLVRNVPLMDIGLAMTENNLSQLETWLSSGVLSRPKDNEMVLLSEMAPPRILIIQPYILVEIEDEP